METKTEEVRPPERLHVVVRIGIHDQGIGGVFSTKELAIEGMREAKAAERDNYHAFEVRPFVLDKCYTPKEWEKPDGPALVPSTYGAVKVGDRVYLPDKAPYFAEVRGARKRAPSLPKGAMPGTILSCEVALELSDGQELVAREYNPIIMWRDGTGEWR
ncbi:MAG: hypothetical protein GY769_08095 [bacterium]|nr:hypothetical protein [bacterium]